MVKTVAQAMVWGDVRVAASRGGGSGHRGGSGHSGGSGHGGGDGAGSGHEPMDGSDIDAGRVGSTGIGDLIRSEARLRIADQLFRKK